MHFRSYFLLISLPPHTHWITLAHMGYDNPYPISIKKYSHYIVSANVQVPFSAGNHIKIFPFKFHIQEKGEIFQDFQTYYFEAPKACLLRKGTVHQLQHRILFIWKINIPSLTSLCGKQFSARVTWNVSLWARRTSASFRLKRSSKKGYMILRNILQWELGIVQIDKRVSQDELLGPPQTHSWPEWQWHHSLQAPCEQAVKCIPHCVLSTKHTKVFDELVG